MAPGLGQHMLARVKGGQRDGTVKIRPGADHHRVNFPVVDQLFPVRIDARNVKLAGNPRRGLSVPKGSYRAGLTPDS